MCAVSGVLVLEPAAAENAAVRQALLRAVGAMNQAQAHRGPDDATVAQLGPLFAGHRRLSVIDLSGGRQPLTNEDGTVHALVNGEIYNHRELRGLLGARGHRFRTRSDSEVALHAYEEWGVEALNRLRGMFALALIDLRGGAQLLLARDPVGEKPLYFSRGVIGAAAGVDRALHGLPYLAFASEAKGLLALPFVTRALDPAGVADFLRYRYVAAPRTALSGVSKLPAGTYLRCGSSNGEDVEPVAYWDLSYRPKLAVGERLCQRLCAEALDDAVRSRLVADVPVGALLSGGLDSSLVVALARRALGVQPLLTFCAGFSDPDAPELDERPQAARAARALATRHDDVLVTEASFQLLPRILWHLDEPLADPSLLPMYCVAERAARDVKVVLTGDGGDEAFAGYDRYRRSRLSDFLRALPRRPHGLLQRGIGLLESRLGPERLARLRARVAQSERAATLPLPQLFAESQSALSPEQVAALLHPSLRERARTALDSDRVAALCERADADHALDRFLYSDLRAYLADGLMVKSDRMTMAHGLEARAPLLDVAMLQLAAALPVRYKRAPGQPGKQILRALAQELLPRPLRAGALGKKRGFTPPLAGFFARRPEALAPVDPRRSTLVEAGVLSADALAAALRDHAGTGDAWRFEDRRFLLLCLELWHRVVILDDRGARSEGAGTGRGSRPERRGPHLEVVA